MTEELIPVGTMSIPKKIAISEINKRALPSKGRILLAEDYPINQRVAMIHLTRAGYQVDLAEDGYAAIELFKQSPINLILIDLQMPKMDGYCATQIIRQLESKATFQKKNVLHPPRVPIIAMTAHGVKGYKENCMNAGMDDYLQKPIKRKALLDMVQKWHNSFEKTYMDKTPLSAPLAEVQNNKTNSNRTPPMDLEKAVAEFGGDWEFVLDLLDEFLKTVRSQIVTMTRALEKKDHAIIRSEAHAIKGGAANLAAAKLARLAHDLEKKAQQNFPDAKAETNTQLLEKIETEIHRLKIFKKNI